MKESRMKGYSLPEVIVYMTCLAVLTALLAPVYQSLVRLRHDALRELELQQQAQYLMSSLIKDIQYGYKAELGQNKITVFTRRNSPVGNKVTYTLDSVGGNRRALRDGQPVTGQSMLVDMAITKMEFTRYGEHTILIDLTAENRSTGAAFSLNGGVMLLNGE